MLLLAVALAKLPSEDLISFQETLDALMERSYSWDLWGAAYVIYGGCSDDAFDYFRAALIMQGEEAFDNALVEADTLADLPPFTECEAMLGLAYDVYHKRSGGSSIYDATIEIIYGEPVGEPFLEDDEGGLKDRYAKLFAKYWNK